jgi:hypothetical protein
MHTEMDYLVLGSFLLSKTEQPEDLKLKYKQEQFEPD